MSRFNHKLPGVLIPEDDVCYPLFIPNHPDYINLVIRALRMLILDRHYERDEAHSAITVREQFTTRMYLPFIDALQAGADCGAGELSEDGDCYAYPLYAPFIEFLPYNPFNGGDPPPGYAAPPFLINDGSLGLPPVYNLGDVIIPFESINLVDFTVFGTPITIAIHVTGSGQVEIDLLQVVQGGVVAIGINSIPNAFDIVQGLVDPNTDAVVNLGIDGSQVPPEDDIVERLEFDITENPGVETVIYLSFLPVIDLDLIPFKFGGGIRSVQLCGFESQGVIMGIEEVRIFEGRLQERVGGTWTDKGDVIEDCTAVEECLTTSPTIATINSNIGTNQANIANNFAAITSNDADIAALQSDVTTIGSLATQNQSDIASNTAQIQANVTAITNVNNTLDDHDDRITDLENAGGGSGNFTTRTVRIRELLKTDIAQTLDATFSLVDGVDCEFAEYDSIYALGALDVYSSGGGFMSARFNSDTTVNNYFTSYYGSPAFGNVLFPIGYDYQSFELRFINLNNFANAQVFARAGYTINTPHYGNYIDYNYQHHMYWHNAAIVTEIAIGASAPAFDLGSKVEWYGERTIEVAVVESAAPSGEWEVFLDFRSHNHGDVILVAEGNGYQGDHYASSATGSTARNAVIVEMGEYRQLTRVLVEYYYDNTSGNPAYVSAFDDDAGAPPFIFQNTSPTLEAIDFEDSGDVSEEATANLENLQVGAFAFSEYPVNATRIYSIRIWGEGVCPAALQPYEVT